MSTVAIIEANAVYALGLKMLAQRCGYGAALVWPCVASAASAYHLDHVDLVLLSEQLLDEFADSPLAAGGGALVLIVDSQNSGKLAQLPPIGFDGLLLRDASEARIIDCLKNVALGHAWLDPALCNGLLHPLKSDWHCLSKRELEIARLAAGGLSNKHIAKELQLSYGTVKIHLHHVFAKLSVSRRSELSDLLHASLPN